MKRAPDPAFGHRLRRLMREREMTHSQLAAGVPCHYTTVCRWLAGHMPVEARLERIATVLGVSSNRLKGDVQATNGNGTPVTLMHEARALLKQAEAMLEQSETGT